MKFGCDSCGAQYMIADEKVGKAGVKVRCKKCSHVIIVKKPLDEDVDQSTVVMDNPLMGMEPAEAPEFADASADMEIGAAFDSIFGEGGDGGGLEAPAAKPAPAAPKDPFAAAVDDAFDAALDGAPLGSFDDSSDYESTRVFSSEDIRRVAEEKEYASSPLFDDGGDYEPEPEPEAEEESQAGEWYVAIEDDQVGPLTVDEVQDHWESGDLSPDSLVWRQGMGDWEPLSSVGELKHVIAPTRAFSQLQHANDHHDHVDARAEEPKAAPIQETESEPVWKPATASLLASLAAEEMSALDREEEEGSQLAGPSSDPVAEAMPSMAASSSALGMDLPPPPPPEVEDAFGPPAEPMQPASSPFAAEPAAQRQPTPVPFAPQPSPAFAAHSHHQAAAMQQQQQGYGPFGQPSGYQGHAHQGMGHGGPFGAYGSGPVTAAPPPPPGMSKRMMLALGGGGAGVSALLVVLILAVTGVIGGDKANASDLVESTGGAQVAPPALPPEQKAPPAGEAGANPAAAAEEAPVEPERAEAPAEQKAETEVAKAPAETTKAPPPPRQTAPRQPTPPRQPPPQTKQPDPVAPATPPAEQRRPRQTSSNDDLEDELFGPRDTGRRTAPAAQREEPAGRQGYIPPAPGARDRDLPREVSRGDIMQVVSSKRADLRNCVNRQRAADPNASGTVVMGWRIQPDGSPTGVRVKSDEHRGTVMAQCLTQVIGTMRFPRYGGPQMAEIEFPFQF